jgi:hypothetical protein
MELLIFIAGYATGVVSVFVAIWTGMRLRDRKPHMTWPDAERHIEEGRAGLDQTMAEIMAADRQHQRFLEAWYRQNPKERR